MNRSTLVLDVDGVLNTGSGLDEDKLNLLASIVTATGCKIVLSSSWRASQPKLVQLTAALYTRGLSIYSMTPLSDSCSPSGLWRARSREEEIHDWFALLDGKDALANPFVILDDAPITGLLAKYHVRTEIGVGLTEELAEEVARRIGLIPSLFYGDSFNKIHRTHEEIELGREFVEENN